MRDHDFALDSSFKDLEFQEQDESEDFISGKRQELHHGDMFSNAHIIDDPALFNTWNPSDKE